MKHQISLITKTKIKNEIDLYESVGRACEISNMQIVDAYVRVVNAQYCPASKREIVDEVYAIINNNNRG